MDVGQPSLDQLRLFLAVADEGSFITGQVIPVNGGFRNSTGQGEIR